MVITSILDNDIIELYYLQCKINYIQGQAIFKIMIISCQKISPDHMTNKELSGMFSLRKQ